MRIIIYGVGAIGGVIAARLALSGQQVIGIARGSQLEAIKTSGLRLRTQHSVETACFPALGDPAEIEFHPNDAIVLAMKSQDTSPALDRLQAAGVTSQAIFCFQNGVVNERMALRRFKNVYGVTVMMPAVYTSPGEVAAFGAPKYGLFDIGCFPSGADDRATTLAEMLNDAGFAAAVKGAVMASKYRKLLSNLGNIVDACFGSNKTQRNWREEARAEGEAALRAAGVVWEAVEDQRRKTLMQEVPVPGVDRIGSSSTQSLVRNSGSIETDYLNGEIVLMGRLHGVPVPINTAFCQMSLALVKGQFNPGEVPEKELSAALFPG